MTIEELQEGAMLLVDKPQKWTSFDVVNKLRSALRLKKVGHAGTLDPLATGLLILCTGKMTKQIDQFQSLKKEYTGCITIGASTPSYDSETAFNRTCDTHHIKEENLLETTKAFIGWQEQIAPAYSAVKQAGKRNYERVRKGQVVPDKKRWVFVDHFEVTDLNMYGNEANQNRPEVYFKIVCSKGTYIRTIAHDFGLFLDNAAYLSALRRTKIGDYSVEKAHRIDDLIDTLKTENAGF